jgi:dipeptidase D
MSDYKVIEGLEPQAVLRCFADLSRIPRVPGKQKQVSDFLANYVRGLGLPCIQDSHLNVIARKPAAPGYEAAPPVMIQAHMDMVCEKDPGVEHDFTRDPLRLRREGDKITADGTTLGADNGVGVAFIMALLADKTLQHPALEAVFTTDEETDMGGAFSLDYSQFQSRLVLNLDAGAVIVSGSGELEVEMRFARNTVPIKPGSRQYTVRIGGLIGGHTGANAMAERGNAIVLLNRLLLALGKKVDYQIILMQGGAGMSSAFARQAECTIAIAPADVAIVQTVVDEHNAVYREELSKRDPDVTVTIAPNTVDYSAALAPRTADTLRKLLCILPDGVFSLNRDFPGAMESCSNVGVVETCEQEMFVTILIRSVIAGKKYYLYDKVTLLCDALGVSHRIGRDLPHWNYNVDEKTARLLREVYPDLEPTISQGTLECGIFCANLPGASVIALGSPYYNPHSPREYFLVSETAQYWEQLLAFLARLK